VAEKHDFRSIQRKIPQNPDFALNQDMNPVLCGDTAADIAKKLHKIFCKNRFSHQKTRFFAKTRAGQPRKTAKIGFQYKNYFRFLLQFQNGKLHFCNFNGSKTVQQLVYPTEEHTN
jgi:hypothetical protein